MADHRKIMSWHHGRTDVDAAFLDTLDAYTTPYKRPSHTYWRKMRVGDTPGNLLAVSLSPRSREAMRDVFEERFTGYAKRLGYGQVGFINLFAKRTGSTFELMRISRDTPYINLVGPLNDDFTESAIAWADKVVFSFGPAPKNRAFCRLINARTVEVFTMCAAHFKLPYAIGISVDGWPLAPHFRPYGSFVPWRLPEQEPRYPRHVNNVSIIEGLY